MSGPTVRTRRGSPGPNWSTSSRLDVGELRARGDRHRGRFGLAEGSPDGDAEADALLRS